MGLETFGFIDDLNPSFPFGSDDVSEGDDHIRGVKETLKNTFPSNDGPGSFPGMDFFLRDIDIRTASISDQILKNPQVAIAAVTIDGFTGNITSASYGIDATVRTGAGQYEILLQDTSWGDTEELQCGLNTNFGLVHGSQFLHAPQVNLGPGWLGISCQAASQNQPGDSDDCALLHIVIFEAGRD